MPSYTLTGPSSGTVDFDSTFFTLTPSGLITLDRINLSDGGAGGIFRPQFSTFQAQLTITNSALPLVFAYNPRRTGSITITLTSLAGYSISGSPFTYTSNVLTTNVPYVNYMYSPTGNN